MVLLKTALRLVYVGWVVFGVPLLFALDLGRPLENLYPTTETKRRSDTASFFALNNLS